MAALPFTGQPGLPPFPTWPPPSGGAPVTKWETGPLAISAPSRTFPAGAYIDGMGSVINPINAKTIGGM
jgi:hypothetical protein